MQISNLKNGLTLGLFLASHVAVTADQGRADCDQNKNNSIAEIVQTLATRVPNEFRTADGSMNNRQHPLWGAANTELLRLCRPAYGDGTNSPAGANRLNPRLISDVCVEQTELKANARGGSDYLWQWGQFMDHDMDLTPVIDPPEPLDIAVPQGDPYFDPLATGTQVITFERSFYVFVKGVRQQVNVNTSYIDASNVYGSDAARAKELRARDGTGRLKMSTGNLLPFNTNGFPNLPADLAPGFFLAGDVRANEQVSLTVMHTLWMREHNFWADQFHRANSRLSDEQIYQLARVVVGAELQSITYNEFLPMLLGPRALSPYRGYQRDVNASIATEFSSAAYRVGHTLLSPMILRLQSNGQTIPAGNLPLREAFFNPDRITKEGGIEPFLRGLAAQAAQEIDRQIVDDVRNFLFGPPGAGGFDLACLNLQRGRDHGLPGYNQVRREMGMVPMKNFNQMTAQKDVQIRLGLAYPTVEDVDMWMGCLSEDHVRGAMVGELIFGVLKNQFERLRDGDRFYYENYLPANLVPLIERQTLATVIRRNTGIGDEIQDEVFLAKPRTTAQCPPPSTSNGSPGHAHR